MFLEICEPAPFQHTPGSCAGCSLDSGGSSSCWAIAQLHSESFETMQYRDEFQIVVKILCYCYKSLGFFLFCSLLGGLLASLTGARDIFDIWHRVC